MMSCFKYHKQLHGVNVSKDEPRFYPKITMQTLKKDLLLFIFDYNSEKETFWILSDTCTRFNQVSFLRIRIIDLSRFSMTKASDALQNFLKNEALRASILSVVSVKKKTKDEHKMKDV